MGDYKFSATCHTKCYWLNNLWQPGEVYEGNHEPNKHFNQSGKAPELPPPDAGSDPRSNVQLRKDLKKTDGPKLLKNTSENSQNPLAFCNLKLKSNQGP